MIFRLFALIFFAWIGSVEAQSPQTLLERDKAACDAAADKQYIWLFNMENWRAVYNTCLRNKLRALSPKYLATTLEAMKLENDCPEYLQNERPVELSLVGIEIVNKMTPKDLTKSATDDNIEHHLLLYYQRTAESKERIRDIRSHHFGQ